MGGVEGEAEGNGIDHPEDILLLLSCPCVADVKSSGDPPGHHHTRPDDGAELCGIRPSSSPSRPAYQKTLFRIWTRHLLVFFLKHIITVWEIPGQDGDIPGNGPTHRRPARGGRVTWPHLAAT